MSERAKIAAEQYGRGLYALRNEPSPQSAFEEGYEQAERDVAKVDSEIPIGLQWGEHERDGGTHTEWHAPCGCAFHPEPYPHVHPCSDGHKRPDLHATQEQAIAAAAREWAKAWGKVWEGDEAATDEVNDKSKTLHDAVLDLEREIVLRRRRAIMPGYDRKLEDWLS